METPVSEQQNAKVVRVALDRAEILRDKFKGNEDALKLIRALFFGFELTEAEKGTLRTLFLGNEELQVAVQKKIYSRLSKDAPIGSNPDFWVGTEQQIQGQHPDTVKQILSAKEKCLKMLDVAMGLLAEPDSAEVINIAEYSPKNDPLGIDLIARNLYVQAIENGLSYIKIIAELSDEQMKKVEETRKKDSTK